MTADAPVGGGEVAPGLDQQIFSGEVIGGGSRFLARAPDIVKKRNDRSANAYEQDCRQGTAKETQKSAPGEERLLLLLIGDLGCLFLDVSSHCFTIALDRSCGLAHFFSMCGRLVSIHGMHHVVQQQVPVDQEQPRMSERNRRESLLLGAIAGAVIAIGLIVPLVALGL